MMIRLGREICGTLEVAETREWLVTNGIGGYACGTVAGLLTRHYHGLLIAATEPPVGRSLLLAKFEETLFYNDCVAHLHCNRWADGTIEPKGYEFLESFCLEGTIPVWRYAIADAILAKRVWMQQGENTTYVQYTLERGSGVASLSLKALVCHRDHHGGTSQQIWEVGGLPHGVYLQTTDQVPAFYLLSRHSVPTQHNSVTPAQEWYYDFDLAIEQYRGTGSTENYLHAATFQTTLMPGQSATFVASTHPTPNLDGKKALLDQYAYERRLRDRWRQLPHAKNAPAWMTQLVLAADQFIVDRLVEAPDIAEKSDSIFPPQQIGKTVIAGYPWFGDWGRDTMISLPGLTLGTGRVDLARSILSTFATFFDQGMLPNVFPDSGNPPLYNTVDASLWYFEAVRAYYSMTRDRDFLEAVFPVLQETITWHQRGTRYGIQVDPEDGLLMAGEADTQLTWMDAKVDGWVVTPRMGKPVEINALWYNALLSMMQFAIVLKQPVDSYRQQAIQTRNGFKRFWNEEAGYCWDVLDTPTGDDIVLRPNQIFAVALGANFGEKWSLLPTEQQQAIVTIVGQQLLTSCGLRSLAAKHPEYCSHYGGNRYERDRAYHQGTSWAWLLGAFIRAHLRVYGDVRQARRFLQPIVDHLQTAGLGTISEIFDADPPHTPRGCFAQAWSVAEILWTWQAIATHSVTQPSSPAEATRL